VRTADFYPDGATIGVGKADVKDCIHADLDDIH
jgi:hypothetical protein